MQETAWAAGAPPRTPLGELTALPQTGEGDGCPLPKNPTPALGFSGLACPHPLIFTPRTKIPATALREEDFGN